MFQLSYLGASVALFRFVLVGVGASVGDFATSYHTSFYNMHNSFCKVRGWPTTRAKDNAPAEEQQPDPEKRQDVLVERSV